MYSYYGRKGGLFDAIMDRVDAVTVTETLLAGPDDHARRRNTVVRAVRQLVGTGA